MFCANQFEVIVGTCKTPALYECKSYEKWKKKGGREERGEGKRGSGGKEKRMKEENAEGRWERRMVRDRGGGKCRRERKD